jgi:hypothetical protein
MSFFSQVGPCFLNFLSKLEKKLEKKYDIEISIYYEFDEILVGKNIYSKSPAAPENIILKIQPLESICWSCNFYRVTNKDGLGNVFLIVFKTIYGKVFGAFIHDFPEDGIISDEVFESIETTFDLLPCVFEKLNNILN